MITPRKASIDSRRGRREAGGCKGAADGEHVAGGLSIGSSIATGSLPGCRREELSWHLPAGRRALEGCWRRVRSAATLPAAPAGWERVDLAVVGLGAQRENARPRLAACGSPARVSLRAEENLAATLQEQGS